MTAALGARVGLRQPSGGGGFCELVMYLFKKTEIMDLLSKSGEARLGDPRAPLAVL